MPATGMQHGSLTWDDLAPDQRKVLFAVACGLSDPEIADVLQISRSKVRNTIDHVCRTLQLSDRIKAILWVLDQDAVAADILATI